MFRGAERESVSKNKRAKQKKIPQDFMMPNLSGLKFEDVVKTMLHTSPPKKGQERENAMKFDLKLNGQHSTFLNQVETEMINGKCFCVEDWDLVPNEYLKELAVKYNYKRTISKDKLQMLFEPKP
jgi:hypothetical protein